MCEAESGEGETNRDADARETAVYLLPASLACSKSITPRQRHGTGLAGGTRAPSAQHRQTVRRTVGFHALPRPVKNRNADIRASLPLSLAAAPSSRPSAGHVQNGHQGGRLKQGVLASQPASHRVPAASRGQHERGPRDPPASAVRPSLSTCGHRHQGAHRGAGRRGGRQHSRGWRSLARLRATPGRVNIPLRFRHGPHGRICRSASCAC